MSIAYLEPATDLTPERSQVLSQQAPTFLKSQTGWTLPYPLSLLVNNESQEKWLSYENIFLASLRTGDYATASKCLEDLTNRFGEDNERALALRGLYKEARSKDNAELDTLLKQYDTVLEEEPTTFALRKRRIALLKSMGRTAEAITALTDLLDMSPIDAEAWAELADLYVQQGAYEQAVFCLEEVLLSAPNAWNMQAKLGEVLYISGSRDDGNDQLRLLSESMRRFCRSIELCDDYLRGYYGLKLTTDRLLQLLAVTKKPQKNQDTPAGELPPPSLDIVKKLNVLATKKLAEITRKATGGVKDWDGYNAVEIAAAKALLDKDTQVIER